MNTTKLKKLITIVSDQNTVNAISTENNSARVQQSTSNMPMNSSNAVLMRNNCFEFLAFNGVYSEMFRMRYFSHFLSLSPPIFIVKSSNRIIFNKIIYFYA